MWIQVLLIAAVIALLVYLLGSRTNAKAKAGVKVGYVLFVIAAVYAILRPDDTTVLANWLRADRGTDLLSHALIIAFAFTTMSTYPRFKGTRVALCPTGTGGGSAERQGAGELVRQAPKYWTVRPSPSIRLTRGRQPSTASARPASKQDRATSPNRAGARPGWSGVPMTSATAVCSARSLVSTPVPTLKRRPPRHHRRPGRMRRRRRRRRRNRGYWTRRRRRGSAGAPVEP